MVKIIKTTVVLGCSMLLVGCYTMLRGPKPVVVGADRSLEKVKRTEQTKLIKDEEEKVTAMEDDEETVNLRNSRYDRSFDFYDPLQPSLRNPRSYNRAYYDPYTGMYYDPYTGAPIPYNPYNGYGGPGGYEYGYDPYSGYPITGFVWTDDNSNSTKNDNPSEAVTNGPGTSPAQTMTPETKRPAARDWRRQQGLWGQPYGAGAPSGGGQKTAQASSGSSPN